MLLFMCFYLGIAQDNITKHRVSRGETIIDIAKKYNVTPYDIQQANLATLNSLDDIKENDVLIIPKSKIKTPQLESASAAIKSSAANQSLTYTVRKGETKYGLAKRFGISISELEASNPHIVSGLNEGHILKVNTSIENIPEPSPVVGEETTDFTLERYKNHLVLKGETLWGISHANGLTVEQLVGNNTDVLTGILREGQTLKVPQIKQVPSPYETYFVKSGDTKYGLSKKYETTIAALEQLNPHIVRMLQIDHTIRIPSNVATNPSETITSVTTSETPEQNESGETIKSSSEEIQTETQEPKTQAQNESDETVKTSSAEVQIETQEPKIQEPIENKEVVTEEVIVEKSEPEYTPPQSEATPNVKSEAYDYYEIQPKETLYGLAKKAEMSIADFVALNPELKESVQIGTTIKMPKKGNEVAETTVSKPPLKIEASGKYKNLSNTINTAQDKKIMFLLPFTEARFSDEIKSPKNFSNVSDEFTRKHLEFYSGAKIAIDSINRLGLTVETMIIEAENSQINTKLMASANEQNIKSYDAIILPFYGNVEENLAALVAEERIPVVTAASIAHQQNVNNLFSAMPSINQQRKKVLDYMTSKEGNIIVVSDVNRTESKDFISAYIPYAKFIELRQNGTFSEDELISYFKKDKLNYVILESERNSVFLNVTNLLLSELNSYSIQLAVLESSIIPDNDDVSIKRYRILKMLIPSLTPAVSNGKSERFTSKYQKTYNSQPTTNAMLGFDITFDTLLRLSQQQTFEASAKNDITEYVRLKFEYKPNDSGGYNNDGIYILQYDTNSNFQEVD